MSFGLALTLIVGFLAIPFVGLIVADRHMGKQVRRFEGILAGSDEVTYQRQVVEAQVAQIQKHLARETRLALAITAAQEKPAAAKSEPARARYVRGEITVKEFEAELEREMG